MGTLFSPRGLLGPNIVFGSSPLYRVGGFGPLPLAGPRMSGYVRYNFYRIGYLAYNFALSSHRHVMLHHRVSELGRGNGSPRHLTALRGRCHCPKGRAYTKSNLYSVSYPVNVGANSLARSVHRRRLPRGDFNCSMKGFTTGRFTNVGDYLHPVLALTGTTRSMLKASTVASLAGKVRGILNVPR